jgi:hypothetical protein
MYIHNSITTIHVLLYTSSILLGRLAVLHSLCPLQLFFSPVVSYCKIPILSRGTVYSLVLLSVNASLFCQSQ